MKKYTKIILAGGSGQIGTALVAHFKDKAESIVILSRSPVKHEGNVHVLTWDGKTAGSWAKELDGADMLINLAGKNVNCRYNKKNKEEIISSRVNSIKALVNAIIQCKTPPKLYIQSASATIYRYSEDKPMTEESTEIGEGFSVEVCKKWEGAFIENTRQFHQMRKAILRISLVMGPKEGVFPRLRNLARFGLGGKQGNGKQMVSWIHEKDVAVIVEWLVKHEELEGVFNCTSPSPIPNSEMMQIIRKAIRIPIGLPAPGLLLEAGAFIIGTETELILKSRWVLPERILHSGYSFQFRELSGAIHACVSGR